MHLNRVEFHLMNNPIRAALQRWVEAPTLLGSIALEDDARVLEVGCGRGVGLEILERRFPRRAKVGFDLDPSMVELAHARVSTGRVNGTVSVADAEAMPYASASFDLVAEFGILHHVPGWRDAISEIGRVLKPGGRFVFEDLTSRFSEHRVVSRFLEHPTGLSIHADRFADALADSGLAVDRLYRVSPWAFFGRAVKLEPADDDCA